MTNFASSPVKFKGERVFIRHNDSLPERDDAHQSWRPNKTTEKYKSMNATKCLSGSFMPDLRSNLLYTFDGGLLGGLAD